ncbi:DUF2271 domain-containing protein [Dyadobacter sediminis]|uniref:DUF2271 domain-containing protein n=1 Tax=Dyadobacter sediminis TaxID=1493691 RepID=A0A5R9KBV5_9BACT|nr:DUF2271 domain-containing protein [Dyadobacter sediminis]TLU92310.1 DUF2271 domain-containing protein [Dyadobacter sediminis]GGB95550.1 hypothetical protein GCM10011325_23640 [Dyadobacter sediminis]
MSDLIKTALIFITLAFARPASSIAQTAGTSKYKCMIQMTNYMGEGAYIVVSLINPKNAYDKTLYVMGPDKKWYNSLKEWHKFQSKKPASISAITGASVTGGDRSVNVLEIESAKINAGYKLRFESAVEDKNYYVKDLEIPLTTEALSAKSEGTGFIRYVRFSPN